MLLSEELKLLIESGRKLQSLRAVRVRATLKLKGKKKAVIARRGVTGVKIRIKTGQDILKSKLKALRNRHSIMTKSRKQKRAFKLTDRGIRA